MSDDLAEMKARLRRLEDKEAILATISRYSHTLDYGPAEGWADCFTPDGAFDIRRGQETGPKRSYSGKTLTQGAADLLEFARKHPVAPGEFQKHISMVPHFVEIGAETAEVHCYFLILHEKKGTPGNTYSGRYIDHMQRCADGVWRFKLRVAEITGTTDDASLL